MTVTVANNGQISIPEKVRQQLGLHDGDQFNLTVTKSGSLILDSEPTAQDWHTASQPRPFKNGRLREPHPTAW
ncbi:AbrB/MazE/SpoVT family DNA-binding domain-containing protein [Levilactobacillus parabrevis]|uniref:AbrB/MazE/SpoVT family DNA-binding domain-containing protein n=1 Tax=Levilactobacillus parabrevis TaxID=357278 RepID=UPI00375706BC